MYGLTPFKPPIFPIWCGANSTIENQEYLSAWVVENEDVLQSLIGRHFQAGDDSVGRPPWAPSHGWQRDDITNQELYNENSKDYFQIGDLYLVCGQPSGPSPSTPTMNYSIIWPDCYSLGIWEGVYLMKWPRGIGTAVEWCGVNHVTVFNSLRWTTKILPLTALDYNIVSFNYPL